MTIGERIKARRKELNLTLKDLYEITNISAGNLSEIERGKYLPGVPALLQLSIALTCSTDWLLRGSSHSEMCFQEPTSSYHTLSPSEADLISMYRNLDERDKKDILDLIQMKYLRNKR